MVVCGPGHVPVCVWSLCVVCVVGDCRVWSRSRASVCVRSLCVVCVVGDGHVWSRSCASVCVWSLCVVCVVGDGCVWSRSHASVCMWSLCVVCVVPPSPFPQIDIIGAMMFVWRVRGKINRFVLCNIVCNSCAQCNALT